MAKWNASVGLQLTIDYDDIEADTKAEAIQIAKDRALEDIEWNNSDCDVNVTKLSQNTPLHSKLSCNGALFCVFSKKHLTNMQFRAAILLSTLSKMALVVRSVSRHKNYKEDYL